MASWPCGDSSAYIPARKAVAFILRSRPQQSDAGSGTSARPNRGSSEFREALTHDPEDGHLNAHAETPPLLRKGQYEGAK